MVEIAIGDWVNRPKRPHLTPAHLVESLIADRVVTRCGRQMHRQAAAGPLERAAEGRYRCFHCSRLGAK